MYKAANNEVLVFLYVEMSINILKDVLKIVRRFQVFSKGTGSSPTLRFGTITVKRQIFPAVKLDFEIIRYQKGFYSVKKS